VLTVREESSSNLSFSTEWKPDVFAITSLKYSGYKNSYFKMMNFQYQRLLFEAGVLFVLSFY